MMGVFTFLLDPGTDKSHIVNHCLHFRKDFILEEICPILPKVRGHECPFVSSAPKGIQTELEQYMLNLPAVLHCNKYLLQHNTEVCGLQACAF